MSLDSLDLELVKVVHLEKPQHLTLLLGDSVTFEIDENLSDQDGRRLLSFKVVGFVVEDVKYADG